MIDFKNGFFKLTPVDVASVMERVSPLMIEGEGIVAAFKTVRDSVVFTNKRIIAVNVQGLIGKKVDYTSLPYSKVQTYSVETAGTFDRDCELDLVFSGLGTVRFELGRGCDVLALNRLISSYVLA